jgi:hypothetical protein
VGDGALVLNLSLRRGAQADDDFFQFLLPVAVYSGNPDDFAGVDLEVDLLQGQPVVVTEGGDVMQGQPGRWPGQGGRGTRGSG